MNDADVSPLAHYQIIRRNGAVLPFEPDKIATAMMKAFLAVHGTRTTCESDSVETVAAVVALLRMELLSLGDESRTAAEHWEGSMHLCVTRARRRRHKLHGGGPSPWRWRIRDG